MYQYGSNRDERLEVLSEMLDGALEALAGADALRNRLWAEIFREFDDAGLSGQPAQYIAGDGFTLTRQMTKPEPVLRPELLEAAIRAAYPGSAGERLWKAVTRVERVVDEEALAGALERGRIAHDVVEAAIYRPESTPKRVRRKHSKADRAALELMDNIGFDDPDATYQSLGFPVASDEMAAG